MKRQEGTGSRQKGGRKATGKRQESDRGATGQRRGSDRQATGEGQRTESAKTATGRRQGRDRMATGGRGGPNLLGEVLYQGLKELGYCREDLSVEVFASNKQRISELYCSRGKNCCYKLYWPSFGMAYGNPRFSELGKVLTKMALERARKVLCSPDWGAHGGNEYWRTLLDRLTISSVRLPDEAIYVPLGCKTPIGKPGWGSMLSVVDGGLTSIPWEDLDSTPFQSIQRESDALTLGDLKDRLQPQDAIETIPGGDEYVMPNTNAPNSPCHVPSPDEVPECGLSELRNVYMNPLERAYVAMVHRRWLNETYYMPTKG